MAKQQYIYQVGEATADNLKDLAALLNVEKVTSKDVAEGGKFADQVMLLPVEDDVPSDTQQAGSGAQEGDGKTGDENVDKSATYSALGDEEVTASADDIRASMPEFAEGKAGLEELKEFIKDIDTPTLEYLAKGLGLEWLPTYHANIHRMRIAQAMHSHFFPELFKPKESSKKKGKFGDLTTERLYAMVDERKLNVKRSGHEPIDRMRAIQALKMVGALAE
jgi:hypothetical protein